MEEPINNDAIEDYFITNNTIEDNSEQTVEGIQEEEGGAVPTDDAEPIRIESLVTEDASVRSVVSHMEEQAEENDTTEASTISVSKVLSVSQIDDMFEFSERKEDDTPEQQTDMTINDEELFDMPSDINLEDVKAAQEESREVDILVCGSCHTVVHFIEAFSEHKPLCKKKSDFHGNVAETKPQVWAFLLWKSAQSKLKRGVHFEESSWKLYQKWCKMPEGIRNAWVRAGEGVMNFSNLGFSKPNDSLIKPLPPRRTEKEDFDDQEANRVVLRKLVQRDSSDEKKATSKSVNDDSDMTSHLEFGEMSQDREIRVSEARIESPRVGFTKLHMVKGKDGEADRMQEEEFVVEKIVSRRFNPRKKQYEYLLKWEGYPSEQNTWEPAENLEACQHLLKAFEENIAKQSVHKQKSTGLKQKIENSRPPSPPPFTHGGRPIRYSKQKALSQVKQWCGSIKPDDAELEMLKRKMPITDSDDEEDTFIKKIKLDRERETDSEDSVGGNKVYYSKSGRSGIMRRPGRPPLKPKITNGTTESLAAVLGLESNGDEGKHSTLDAINRGLIKKSTGLSPHNQQVLVANAKGVVKVDPSQVPNLSSGVYIMSNKSGIIKLDSVTPSKALSLKGVNQSTSVKQLPSTPSNSLSSNPTSSSGITTTTQSGVIVVNRESQGPSRSGIMRRPGVTHTRGRGVGRPPLRPQNVRAANPNTRLIHSGSRSNIGVTSGIRPRLPIKSGDDLQKRANEGDRRLLGSKLGRGGMGRGAGRGGRGGISGVTITTVRDKSKEMDPDNVFMDLPQESSSDSDAGLSDLFPTGKVLLKADGEKTSHQTSQSPKTSLQMAPPDMITIKEESSNPGTSSSFLSKVSTGKETLVKKTLKPGSIGSMSVSPKKTFTDDSDDIVTISGEDGTLYKVRKSELNNTLLVSGDDGQQCVYVATGEDGDENSTVLTLDASSYGDVSQLEHVNILGGDGDNETQFYVKDGEEGELVSLQVEGSGGSGSQDDGTNEDGQAQVVAQLVEAGEPAPGGGPRRVVLLLPDGNLMMTEVDEEQYAALELDKYQAPTDLE